MIPSTRLVATALAAGTIALATNAAPADAYQRKNGSIVACDYKLDADLPSPPLATPAPNAPHTAPQPKVRNFVAPDPTAASRIGPRRLKAR